MGVSVDAVVGGSRHDRWVDFMVGDAITGCELPEGPDTEVSIPYEGGDLRGQLYLANVVEGPRPTVVYTSGFGPTGADGAFDLGAAALRRGYNFLTYEGPGQGSTIDEGGVVYRPDWEHVLGPVVDFALTVPEVDDARIVQFGHGLGGHLVARYASRDDRSAAIVCSDAMTTFYASCPPIPESILELIEKDRDDEAIRLLDVLAKGDATSASELEDGTRMFGADTSADYVRRTADYSLTATDIRNISTPALIVEGDVASVFAGQAATFAHTMKAPVQHVVMRSMDGAVDQTVFDWLATTLR
ncbi:MAG: peptidase [Mycobacterium sp.]|jgi:pimeloyl-ACP methyl ester carboxylesterase|nr:peptidase [Mycobacterium sp.]